MKLTNGKGVDLVVDSVGGSTLQGSILSLGYRGRVSMVGNAGRESIKLDVGNASAFTSELKGVGFPTFETVDLDSLDLTAVDFKASDPLAKRPTP